MKKKSENFAKRIAKEITKGDIKTDQSLINEILGISNISLSSSKEQIMAIRVSNSVFHIWKSVEDNRFEVVNSTTQTKDSKITMTREEVIKDIILKAFYKDDDYKKIAKKLE